MQDDKPKFRRLNIDVVDDDRILIGSPERQDGHDLQEAATPTINNTRLQALTGLNPAITCIIDAYNNLCKGFGIGPDFDFIEGFANRVNSLIPPAQQERFAVVISILIARLTLHESHQEDLNLALTRFVNGIAYIEAEGDPDDFEIFQGVFMGYYTFFSPEAMEAFPIDEPDKLVDEFAAMREWGALEDEALAWYLGFSNKVNDGEVVTLRNKPVGATTRTDYLSLEQAFIAIREFYTEKDACVVLDKVMEFPWCSFEALATFLKNFEKFHKFFDNNALLFFAYLDSYQVRGAEDLITCYISEDKIPLERCDTFFASMWQLKRRLDHSVLSSLLCEDMPNKLLPLLAEDEDKFTGVIANICSFASEQAPFETGYERGSFRVCAAMELYGIYDDAELETFVNKTDEIAARFPEEDPQVQADNKIPEELKYWCGRTKRRIYAFSALAATEIAMKAADPESLKPDLSLVPEAVAVFVETEVLPTGRVLVQYCYDFCVDGEQKVTADELMVIAGTIRNLPDDSEFLASIKAYIHFADSIIESLPNLASDSDQHIVLLNAYLHWHRFISYEICKMDVLENEEVKAVYEFLKNFCNSHAAFFEEMEEAAPYLKKYNNLVNFLDANGFGGLCLGILTLGDEDFCLFLDAFEIEADNLDNEDEMLFALNTFAWINETFEALAQCKIDFLSISPKHLADHIDEISEHTRSLLLRNPNEKIAAVGKDILSKLSEIKAVIPLLRIIELFSGVEIDVGDIRLMNEGTEHTRAMVMMGAFIILIQEEAFAGASDTGKLFPAALPAVAPAELVEAIDLVASVQVDTKSRLYNALNLANDLIEAHREENEGLGPIGGKLHVPKAIDQRLVKLLENTFGLYSTYFKLVHAGKSLALPPAQSPFELKLTVLITAIMGLLGEITKESGPLGKAELQITASGNWSDEICGIVGSTVILASNRNVVYPEGSFAHNMRDKWRTRFMIRGAGNRVLGLPDDIESDDPERVDTLARFDLGDIDIKNFMKKLANDYESDGPYKPLMEDYMRELKFILAKHGLFEALSESSWVSNIKRDVASDHKEEIETEAEVKEHEKMINKFTQAWLDAQNEADFGVHGEVRALLEKTYFRFRMIREMTRTNIALAA